ncbi:ribosomal protein S6 kinase delta-1 isoform X2 [Orussus abietinus]|uniref:ribosomal protein S6 kinase delta-1 isoform X2 n=1 Tax=Orussus abietinus TaxID=222816 RepID=UPI000625A33B|nr:ribosomal protein S6 kinase delta-1 isoform X2 [Orussus abietinus]
MAPWKDKFVKRFVITETTQHKKGFTVYKVTSLVFIKDVPEAVSKVSVWKRYSEFKRLHSALKSQYANLKIKEPFPSFPQSKFFGRFEIDVIEERRTSAVKFLEFVARHASLYTSTVFMKFFETSQSKDSITDCSQSLSSDTSEEDHNTSLDKYSDKNRTLQHFIPQSINFSTPTNLISPFLSKDKGESVVSKNSYHFNGSIEPYDGSALGSFKDTEIVTNSVENLITEGQSSLTKQVDIQVTDSQLEYTKHTNGISDKHCRDINPLSDKQSIVTRECINGFVQDASCDASNIVIHDGSDLPNTTENAVQYILIAAAHMSAAFRHEAIIEYEEAFTQYKLGISHLLNGVQTDPDLQRRIIIKEKISKYLNRAERLYNRHLNCNILALNKPVSDLQNYKVFQVVGSAMLVKDIIQGCTRVIKTIEKPAGVEEDISNYILRGKVPYMVQLYGCIQTETTIFLVLQYVSSGKLWEYIKTHWTGHNMALKKNHTRSVSCDAAIYTECDKIKNCNCNDSSEEQKSANIKHDKLNECHPCGNVNNEENSFDSSNYLEDFRTDSKSSLDLPTIDLLKNAKKLLQSVNATLKKSNSIASRLNESEQLYNRLKQNSDKSVNNSVLCMTNGHDSDMMNSEKSPSKSKNGSTEWQEQQTKHFRFIDDSENTEESYDTSELSTSDSFTDISISKEKEPSASADLIAVPNTLTETTGSLEEIIQLWNAPEDTVRVWAAEILLALETLHQQDIIVSDLTPDNILIDEMNHVVLTYIVPQKCKQLSRIKKPYTAPELCLFSPLVSTASSADVWSFGVLLYELLTGTTFQSKHPGLFHSHSTLNIPEDLSKNAKSLLINVLKYEPSDRMTIPDIKEHPFFEKMDWVGLLDY